VVKRLALALLLVGLCLVVATASALTPSRWSPVGQNEFRALSSVPVDAGALQAPQTGKGPAGPQNGPIIPGRPSILPSTRPALTARPLRTYFRQSVAGVATWQPLPGLFGSAGPVLRAAGVKVGQTVRVCSRGNCVAVTIWPGGCWCKVRPGGPTLIDLSNEAFARLVPLSVGVLEVSVRW
jgi:hypothetical protein